MNQQPVPTKQGLEKIYTTVDNWHSHSRVTKKCLQINTRLGERVFIGFVTHHQNIGKVNDASSISIVKANGAVIGKGHVSTRIPQWRLTRTPPLFVSPLFPIPNRNRFFGGWSSITLATTPILMG